MPESALIVQDLVVRYGGRTAVDGLSFSAPQGQVLALIGPNGAGKTSTVECCSGLRTPDSGSITILGARLPRSGPPSAAGRGRIGVMLQDGGLYPSARPLELVAHVARMYDRSERPEELLSALGIDPRTRTTIRRLSGGEQQRVKCALALVGRPDLVLLDEPTAGLDSEGRRRVHDLIGGVLARGATVLLTTHLMDDVERLATGVVLIEGGRALRAGPLTELVGAADTIWLQVGAEHDPRSIGTLLPGVAVGTPDSEGWIRIDGSNQPAVLRVIVDWCGANGVPTTAVTIGPRPLADVVDQAIRACA